jgi:hypothetical protein
MATPELGFTQLWSMLICDCTDERTPGQRSGLGLTGSDPSRTGPDRSCRILNRSGPVLSNLEPVRTGLGPVRTERHRTGVSPSRSEMMPPKTMPLCIVERYCIEDKISYKRVKAGSKYRFCLGGYLELFEKSIPRAELH